jgi:hypothetical protein
MKRTTLAIISDLSGKKPARRGTLEGVEGTSTPTEKITETTKAAE